MSVNYPKRLVLLDTQSASSSASIVITDISSNFTNYYLKIRKILPATNNVILCIQFSTDGGSTYITTGTYNLTTQALDTTGANKSDRNIAATETYVYNYASSTSTRPYYADIVFFNLNQSVVRPRFMSRSMGTTSAPDGQVTYATGINTTTTPITAFKVYFSSGNIASGDFYFYGCNEGGLLY